MKINRTELENFRRDFKATMKKLEEQYNVTITPDKINYSDDNFTMKVLVANEGLDLEKEKWDTYCSRYTLRPEDYNTEIIFNGRAYKLIGIRPDSPKFPIVCQREDGETYKLTSQAVRNSLSRNQ